MRTINVCSGIGDNIWLLMKLINQSEKFHFRLPANNPQRGKQIFDIFPQVSISSEYNGLVATEDILATPNDKRLWSDIIEDVFNLSCNHHLDTGIRIENFLPDLPTSFILNYDTLQHSQQAEVLIPSANYIGLYSSSYRTAKSWQGWSEREWVSLAEMLYRLNPETVFVIIGADWDTDLEGRICAKLTTKNIPFIKVIGQHLGLVCEILKRLKYFIGFPSGLSILNETVGARGTVMFYPKHLEPMQTAWADPVRIESGQYKGCQFCEPKVIFDWLVENKKI